MKTRDNVNITFIISGHKVFDIKTDLLMDERNIIEVERCVVWHGSEMPDRTLRFTQCIVLLNYGLHSNGYKIESNKYCTMIYLKFKNDMANT